MIIPSRADLRDAVRSLRASPAVTLCTVGCLALGIAATAAVASAVDRALVRHLPFRDPARLVTVYRTTPQSNAWSFSVPNYLDLAQGTRREELAAIAWATKLMALPAEGVNVQTMRVTGNLFGILGARAELGRLLDAVDDSGGQNPVAVISDELWRERFGADPHLVGRTVRLDGVATSVVGILPPAFRIPHGGFEIVGDVWVPMRFTPAERRHKGHFLMVLGRLRSGATAAGAAAELRTLVDGLVASDPEMRGESARAVAMQSDSVREIRTPLLLVFGAVGMVLLIAAANVGSMLLARGVHRQREQAVRTALGATRWAVVRPVIAECAILTMTGGVLGIALAEAAVRTIGRLAVRELPQLAGLAIEIRILVFSLVLCALVALVCSSLPAWYSATVDPYDALAGSRGSGPRRSHQRALSGLVVAEVALSLTLLIGASLALHGFVRLVNRDPGFDPRPLLTLVATVSPERYGDSNPTSRFLQPALERIEQVPGVRSAGSIDLLPYRTMSSNASIRYEGQPNTDLAHVPLVEIRTTTPDFATAMGERLIAGRMLRWDDERAGAPAVVVVNQALAQRDFPGEGAVGHRFYVNDTTLATIVGIVSDIPNTGPADPALPEVDWPYAWGWGRGETYFNIVVRAARGDPVALEQSVRSAIRAIDRTASVARIEAMSEVMAESVGTPRFYLAQIGTFALVAVALAVAGLYGVMSYVVAQRTREFGIRAALGSSPSRTLRMVAGLGMRLVVLGALIGALCGSLVTRLLDSLLYGVSPADAPTWLAATLALAGVGFVASLIPALRAMTADPIVAIRTDR